MYCSTKCSALDRKRRATEKNGEISGPRLLTTRYEIPENVVDSIRARLGEDTATVVLQEMEATSARVPQLPTQTRRRSVVGGREGYGAEPTMGSFRSWAALTFDEIESMLLCGPVREALMQKKAGIRAAWRNRRAWTVIHPDEQFAALVKADFARALDTFLDDLLTSLEYGSSFANPWWRYTTPAELGVPYEKIGIQPGQRFAGLAEIATAAPETIYRILYTGDGHFNGFEQIQAGRGGSSAVGQRGITMQVSKTITYPAGQTKTIKRYEALVVPHNGRFRNLWGESWCEPLWTLRYWYEVMLRMYISYLERVGEPKVLGRAPLIGNVKDANGNLVDAMDAMLYLAGEVPKSNATVIPSDRDDGGNYKYELDYLTVDTPADPYISGVHTMYSLIKGAGLTGDAGYSSGKQKSESYASAEVHERAAAQDDERILSEQMAYINLHLMPRYSEYNLGVKQAPPVIAPAGLDRLEREQLSKVLLAAMNTDIGTEIMEMVDWSAIMGGIMVPVLSSKEIDEIREKRKQEAEEAQQRAMDLAASRSKKPEDQENFQKSDRKGGTGGEEKPGENRPGRGPSRAT